VSLDFWSARRGSALHSEPFEAVRPRPRQEACARRRQLRRRPCRGRPRARRQGGPLQGDPTRRTGAARAGSRPSASEGRHLPQLHEEAAGAAADRHHEADTAGRTRARGARTRARARARASGEAETACRSLALLLQLNRLVTCVNGSTCAQK
ncbi:unnamed protein product, partial [Prorocentrum cordatum]